MKRTNVTLAAIAISIGFGSAALAADVAVTVGQPGYYGRIELDANVPKPVLVSPQPVIIEREHVVQEPTYVYVPVEQQRDWARYCGKYDACGRPVYFVEEHWYNDVYVPNYRTHHTARDERRELKEDVRDAKRDAKDAKRDYKEAKRDYKDAKRDAREHS